MGGWGDCSFKQPEDGINSPLRTRAQSGDAQAHDVRDLATIASQPRIKLELPAYPYESAHLLFIW